VNFHRHFRWLSSVCFAAALVCLLAGCGPAVARLSGKVTLAGQPVSGAELVLAPVNDNTRNYRGLTIADGTYQIDYGPAGGLPLGEYRVTVTVHQTAAGALLPEGEAGQVLKNSGQAIQRQYVLNLTVDQTTSQVDWNLDTAQPEN
jgi:hypothetical protein